MRKVNVVEVVYLNGKHDILLRILEMSNTLHIGRANKRVIHGNNGELMLEYTESPCPAQPSNNYTTIIQFTCDHSRHGGSNTLVCTPS